MTDADAVFNTSRFAKPVRVSPEGTVTETPSNGAGSLLAEAARIVEGARNQQHGDKERSFVAIAGLWGAYLQHRRNPDGPLRAQDVAVMMSLMKVMRSEWGTPIRDHFVDMAGYAGIAGELALDAVKGGIPEG
jgi:hypothetical protein